MFKALFITVLSVLVSILSGCVTKVAADLPASSLPEVTLASEVPLVISPSAPTSYLPIDVLPAGATLQVLGQDEDSAWLLVLYNQHIGWIPSVFSRSNIARIQPALTFRLPTDTCTEFVSVLTDLQKPWVSSNDGDIRVIGSVYRQGAESGFAGAILGVQPGTDGSIRESDYLHIPLTPDRSLVLFTYLLSGVQAGEAITFELDQTGPDEIYFQAAFLLDSCREAPPLLSIGELRIPLGTQLLENISIDQEQSSVGALSEPPASIQVLSQNGAGPFYDGFDSSKLEAGWFWLNEYADQWSLEVTPGYLRIMTDEGDMAEKCRNQRNILLREAPSGNFSAQTKVLFDPNQNYQQAGIVIHDDPDHYVKLDLVWSDSIIENNNKSVVGIELLSEEDGEFVEWPWPSDILRPNEAGVLLRLTKSGSWYDGYYSVDGQQWIRVGSLEAATITQPKVGLFALTGVELSNCRSTAPQIPVDFDYFYVDVDVDMVENIPALP